MAYTCKVTQGYKMHITLSMQGMKLIHLLKLRIEILNKN
jgi:hypothetical protein